MNAPQSQYPDTLSIKNPFINYMINSFMTESLSYRNLSVDLLSKSMDWFLYDKDLRHEKRVKQNYESEKEQISTCHIHHVYLPVLRCYFSDNTAV